MKKIKRKMKKRRINKMDESKNPLNVDHYNRISTTSTSSAKDEENLEKRNEKKC